MKKRERAFSLIEVLIAMSIVAVAILPIASMYPGALKMTIRANNNEELSRTSVTILDYVKSRGYKNTVSAFALSSTNSSFYKEYGSTTTSGFVKTGDNTFSNLEFEKKLFQSSVTTPTLFFINSKGMNLSNYKYSISFEKINPLLGTSGGTLAYGEYDLNNYIKTTGKENEDSKLIYGIVKIRKKEDVFTNEINKDIKFIITPMEEWRK